MPHITEVWARKIVKSFRSASILQQLWEPKPPPELKWLMSKGSISITLEATDGARADDPPVQSNINFDACAVGTIDEHAVLVFAQPDGWHLLMPDPDGNALIRGPFESREVAMQMADSFFQLEYTHA